MIKYLTLAAMALSLSFAASPAFAQEDMAAVEQCEANTVTVHVNGLVCDFCAQALKKVFSKEDAVDHISVDLDNSVVTVYQKDGQTIDNATLEKLVTDSGYNVTGIDRCEI